MEAETSSVVLAPIVKLPPMARAAFRVADVVVLPGVVVLRVRSPLIVVRPVRVLIPWPLRLRLLYVTGATVCDAPVPA